MFDESRLDAEILDAIETEWRDNHVPLLFSQLGLARLSEEAKSFVKDNQVSLKRHIKARLADRLRLLAMTREGGGVVPLEETAGLSDSQLEEAYARFRATKAPTPRRVRFDPEIWNAFVTAVPEGSRRVASFAEGRPSVRLESQDVQLSDGDFPIESHDTAAAPTPDGAPDYDAARRAILDWASQHHVSRSQVEADPTQRFARSRQEEPVFRGGLRDTRSVGFLEILRALPKDQLARLNVPGDVVLSILELMVRR